MRACSTAHSGTRRALCRHPGRQCAVLVRAGVVVSERDRGLWLELRSSAALCGQLRRRRSCTAQLKVIMKLLVQRCRQRRGHQQRAAAGAHTLTRTPTRRRLQHKHNQEPGATVLVAGATGGVGQLVTAKLLEVFFPFCCCVFVCVFCVRVRALS